MRIRVLDVETTGFERTDHVVEIAAWDLEPETGMVARVAERLIKPPVPVPAVASAVHHLTDEDLEKAEAWELVWPMFIDDEVDAYAAHCASFEKLWLGDHTKKPWVCTLKCAYRKWPDAPGHSNQVLRYHLKPPLLEPRLCREAHRASADAYITAHLLALMFKSAKVELPKVLEWMVQTSIKPSVLPGVYFGKYGGKKWSEVPMDYLEWVLDKRDMDEDVKYTARFEINLRREAAAKAGQQEMGV